MFAFILLPKFISTWIRNKYCVNLGHKVYVDIPCEHYAECGRCGDTDIGVNNYDKFWSMTKGYRQTIHPGHKDYISYKGVK